MGSLDGKIILVTGARSRGLARRRPQALSQAGATLVLTARDGERLAEVERSIAAAGGTVWSQAVRRGPISRRVAALVGETGWAAWAAGRR